MSDATFYVNLGGRTIGPTTEQQVIDAILAGKIPSDADICRVGDPEWRYVREVEPFARELVQAATPPPPPRRTEGSTVSDSLPAPEASAPTAPAQELRPTTWLIVGAAVAFVSAATIGVLGGIQPSARRRADRAHAFKFRRRLRRRGAGPRRARSRGPRGAPRRRSRRCCRRGCRARSRARRRRRRSPCRRRR